MPSLRYITTASALIAILLATSGCAVGSKDMAPDQSIECVGNGIGLAKAPTPATKKAISDHDATSALSIEELQNRAARENVAAQIELGLRYANGNGISQDGERAVSLFTQAAKQGNPIATYFLGTAYANGLGVSQDEAQAISLWEIASEQGYANAQYWLAFMIANGRGGISANWCAAIPLFQAAAAQDLSDAAFMLGLAYHEGKLGIPNYDSAAYWYRKATSKVLNQKAQYNLRLLIEAYLVNWQEGDPGKPPAPKQDAGDGTLTPELKIIDKSAESVG